ncbi:MAG: hypothetical protein M1828_007362 [Chrysothrix sp. TS-e1954]|nr:MAG: hypothetical protein M1828_007362 [Chrysothrix sp. TS-e1954]
MAAARSTSTQLTRQLPIVQRQPYRKLHMTSLVYSAPRVPSANNAAIRPRKSPSTNTPRATSKPTTPTTHPPRSHQSRPFTTTSSLQTQLDASPIDCAFLPSLRTIESSETTHSIRVPLVPENFNPRREGVHAPLPSDYERVHRAEIATAAANSTHVSVPAGMSEVTDGHVIVGDAGVSAMEEGSQGEVQGREGAERASERGAGGGGGEGFVKQLWSGLVDDVFGEKLQRQGDGAGAGAGAGRSATSTAS